MHAASHPSPSHSTASTLTHVRPTIPWVRMQPTSQCMKEVSAHTDTHTYTDTYQQLSMCVRWSADKRLLHTARSGVCVYPNNPEWVHINYIHGI